MSEVQMLWGVEAWVQAQLDGTSSEYDDYLKTGEYMLHGTKLSECLRMKAPGQQLKVQKILIPSLRLNVMEPITRLKDTPGFKGALVMPNKTHPSGYKLWPVEVVIEKFNEKLAMLEKSASVDTLAKIIGYSMFGAYCLGCGQRESFSALKSAKVFEAPRMFFDADVPTVEKWALERHKLTKSHWAELPAWCTKCRVKCSVCQKMLPRKMNWEWLSSLLNDGSCHVCGGDRLVNVKAPQPDRKSLAQISHRFIIG